MNTTSTDRADYAKGYTNGQAGIAFLATIKTPEEMRTLTIAAIIPIHVRNASMYDTGLSEAWKDFQASQRLANRRNRWAA